MPPALDGGRRPAGTSSLRPAMPGGPALAASLATAGPLLLRTILALWGPGYIHPDEWHQSGEFAAAVLLPREGGAHRERMALPWEFSPLAPARSATTIVWSQLPLLAAAHACRHLGWAFSARHVFLAERLTFLLWMALYDRLLHRLLQRASVPPRVARAARTLHLTSAAALSIMPRPFSNTLEALLLLGVLVLVQELRRLRLLASTALAALPSSRSRHTWSVRWMWHSGLLGALGALGLFARFTFVLFAAPSACYFLWLAVQVARSPIPSPAHNADTRISKPASLLRLTRMLLPGLIGFAGTSLLHVSLDTYIFHAMVPARADGFGGGSWDSAVSSRSSGDRTGHTVFWPPVVAPLNAARYNADAANLALHGTHPRWLHAVVNGPMIFGSMVWAVALCMAIVVLAQMARGLSKPHDQTRSGRLTYRQRQIQNWQATTPMLECAYAFPQEANWARDRTDAHGWT